MVSASVDHPRFLSYITKPGVQVFLAALILCGILFADSFFYIYQPYDGMQVYQEDPLGEVFVVYFDGPADRAGVEIGDLILAVANNPVDPLRSEPRYPPGLKPGDSVGYELQRGDERIELEITIGSYLENLNVLGPILGIQLLSLVLWAIGLVLALFVPPGDMRARLLSLGFLLAGLTAAMGGASGWNSFWGTNTIQQILLCFLGALLVTAHLAFPAISFSRYRRKIIYAVFALAGILSMLVLIENWLLVPMGFSVTVLSGIDLRQWVLLFFMLSWLSAIALLIYNRYRSADLDIRRQTGIIIWGMVLGIGPFFVFTLLPYILFGEEYLQGFYTILFLILLPLAYAYVIFQNKLLRVDFIINRILVWFILILLVLVASISVFSVFILLFELPSRITLYGGLVAVLVALPFASLSKVIQKKVNQVLYGSYYDFVTVTSTMANQLAQTLDRDRLVELLTRRLPEQMGIQRADLLLIEGSNLLSPIQDGDGFCCPVDDPVCLELLRSRHPVRSQVIWDISNPDLQNAWCEYDWSQVIVPMVFENKLLGLLILGRRASGDVYSDEDLSIIATVAEQGALATANVLMYETQRELAQQLVRTDEEQRKQLASELHDSLLQELFFIKQGLHKNSDNPELLGYVERSIKDLRRIIKAQRPPLLDRGLFLAVEGLIMDMQKVVGLSTTITWHNDVRDTLSISDEIATSFYRIAQEALNNAVKHACARNIAVCLEQDTDQKLRLQVTDDGKGVQIDGGEQPSSNHFGQVLMYERAMMIDAVLQIQSFSGQGTNVLLEVTL